MQDLTLGLQPGGSPRVDCCACFLCATGALNLLWLRRRTLLSRCGCGVAPAAASWHRWSSPPLHTHRNASPACGSGRPTFQSRTVIVGWCMCLASCQWQHNPGSNGIPCGRSGASLAPSQYAACLHWVPELLGCSLHLLGLALAGLLLHHAVRKGGGPILQVPCHCPSCTPC